MPRNGSGTYSLPAGNPVVSGTLIEASWANTTLSDLASAMTDSLSRDGEGGMTAALRLFDGTVSVPGLAFTNETSTGLYRAGSGDVRLSITGSQVVQFLASGVAITGTLSVSGNTTLSGGTANGVAYLNGSKVLTTGSALTFNGASIGLGMTPSTWDVDISAIEMKDGSVLASAGPTVFYSSNAYYDTAWKYKVNGPASYFRQVNGVHSWYTAPSGTAGNAIWFTPVMTLDASGNLGVGTAVPGVKLDVQTSAATAGNFKVTSSTAQVINITASNDVDTTVGLLVLGSAAGSLGMLGAGAPALYTAATELNLMANNASGVIKFAAGGTSEQMRLTSTGLGIGTSSPAGKLHVAGQTRIQDSANAANYILIGSGANAPRGGNSVMAQTSSMVMGTEGAAPLIFITNAAEGMRLDASGNLGLGVTPSAWGSGYKSLDIGSVASFFSDSNVTANVSANQYIDAGGRKYKTTNYATMYQQYNGAHQWFTAPSGTAGNAISFTQAMTLDASGNLVVGGTSAVYTNSNRGNISINGASTALLALSTGGTGRAYLYSDGSRLDLLNTQNDALTFGTNNTERARIDSSGWFAVGTTTQRGQAGVTITPATSAGAGELTFNRASTTSTSYVVGFQNAGSTIGYIAYSNSTVTYNTGSDARLKENVTPAPASGPIVDAIQIVQHDWKSGGHADFSVVAQDLHPVYPQAVTPGDDGEEVTQTWGVDYSKLVPLLVKELQSVRARLAALEAA